MLVNSTDQILLQKSIPKLYLRFLAGHITILNTCNNAMFINISFKKSLKYYTENIWNKNISTLTTKIMKQMRKRFLNIIFLIIIIIIPFFYVNLANLNDGDSSP